MKYLYYIICSLWIFSITNPILTFARIDGVKPKGVENTIYLYSNDEPTYAWILRNFYPEKIVNQEVKIEKFTKLKQGGLVEVFSDTATQLISSGLDLTYRIDYLATPIIAVDRSRTRLPIRTWRDLDGIDEKVSIDEKYLEYMMAAASYGMEGENYTLRSILNILRELQNKGRLVRDGKNAAIMILFDYQAVELKKSGKNLDIIVPSEGTLSFGKGLIGETKQYSEFLTKENLVFSQSILEHGYRFADGTRYYEPEFGNYDSAKLYLETLPSILKNSISQYRRYVLKERILSSSNGVEHQTTACMYIALIALWVGIMFRRIIRKDIRVAVLLIGIQLILWGLIRLFKYQVTLSDFYMRQLWFSYYIFMAGIPTVMLWISLRIQNPEQNPEIVFWFYGILIIDILVVILVFMNDIHRQIFVYDLSDSLYAIHYHYGWLYYCIAIYLVSKALLAIFMFYRVARLGGLRLQVLPIILLLALLVLYLVGYIMRAGIIFQTDLTIVIGIFSMLLFEVGTYIGMIPINTGYEKLIRQSSLHLHILDPKGCVLLKSERVGEKRDCVIRHKLISGGTVVWEEDISRISALKNNYESLTYRIRVSNSMLVEEETTRAKSEKINARTELLSQLEKELKIVQARLSTMVFEYVQTHDTNLVPNIMLMLCYIKRRCNLFFRKGDEKKLPVRELALYMDELAQLAAYSKIRYIFSSETDKYYDGELIHFIYDFYYMVLSYCAKQHISAICRLWGDIENCSISFMLAGRFKKEDIPERFLQAIQLYHGEVEVTCMGLSSIIRLDFRVNESV